VLYIQGRQHKVKIQYASEPVEDYLQAALQTIFSIHTRMPTGDVLVFLPGPFNCRSLSGYLLIVSSEIGQDDIESLAASIRTYAATLPHYVDSIKRSTWDVRSHLFPLHHPIHADLTPTVTPSLPTLCQTPTSRTSQSFRTRTAKNAEDHPFYQCGRNFGHDSRSRICGRYGVGEGEGVSFFCGFVSLLTPVSIA